MKKEPQKAAVVLVDMQIGFDNSWTDRLQEKIIAFLESIKETDTPVVGTRYVNHEHTACYLFEGWKDCMAGSKQAMILPKLEPYLQRVFEKDKFSCWNEQMKQFVKENAIDKLYFAGVNTGCCVLNSVFDCYNDLMDCCVISDLCGSTSGPEEHEAALIVLRSCITQKRVITAAQAAEEICTSQQSRASE